MQFKVGFGTDTGRKRSQNQDSAVALPELGLFIVSDGMGGHRGGETASSTAVEVIAGYLKPRLTDAARLSELNSKQLLLHAIETANQAIFERSLQEPQLKGMGTTTTALLFRDNTLTIGHVGDSRCYYLRPHSIWQLTSDHSLVQEKLKAGLISREEARRDRMKNIITRSVGYEKNVDVEMYQMKVVTNDCFLVCSDGLSGQLDDPSILRIVQNSWFENSEINMTVHDLIDSANETGGDDNITAIFVQVC